METSTYHIYRRVIFTLFILCGLTFWGNETQAMSPKNVLLLHSYHQGRLWTDKISEGIQSKFQENGIEGEFYTEYMDTKRFFDGMEGQFVQNLRNTYEAKYHSIDLDVIISSDDNAFQFLLKYRHILFPGVPVVFCGVNHFTDEMLADHPDVTGVLETLDREATIELGIELHPETRHIAFITDTTTTGRGNRRILENWADQERERISPIFIDKKGHGLSHVELITALKDLPKDSIVYFSDFNLYKDGTYVYQRGLLEELSKKIEQPIYSPYSILFGAGIVGGKLNEGFYQGQVAAAMAARILQGEAVVSVPVQKKSPNKFVFDYRQLHRFNLSQKELPEGSLVFYEPVTFYFKYKRYVRLSIVFVGLQTVAIILLLANIRRRKTAESDLLDSEQRFRGIFEQAAVGIALLALDGRWLRVNQKLCNIVGYSKDEMMQRTYQSITHPDDLEADLQHVEQMLAGEIQTFSLENRYIRKDLSHVWINLTVSLVQDETTGVPKYLITIIEDISNRKKTEKDLKKSNEQLRHAEKLSAIGKLSASIAHEFNNPLAGIQSVIEGVKRNIVLNEQDQKLIDLALLECDRVKNLIKNLQDFNRASSGVKQTVDIHTLLDDMLLMVKKEFQNSHISIKREYALELPKVQVVTDQLKQVFLNLLTNAKDAIVDNSGKVTISTEMLNDTIAVRIKDTGSGIAQDDLAYIFEPFFTTKSAVKGTGLGLSVSYGIIKGHGGEILVDSAPGKETTFSVILPVTGEVK